MSCLLHMLISVLFYIVDQEFVTVEVLKLYGLAKDQSQKTDWQKMLKFGRKKRDRVDHILVSGTDDSIQGYIFFSVGISKVLVTFHLIK